MFEKINVRKWTRRDWVLLSIFAVIALAGIAVGHLNDPTGGTAGTGSIAGPAYPYADASQCPLSTDLVFWPNSRSIPSMPPSISVCFVGKSVRDQNCGCCAQHHAGSGRRFGQISPTSTILSAASPSVAGL
jgi:hypothetical protein